MYWNIILPGLACIGFMRVETGSFWEDELLFMNPQTCREQKSVSPEYIPRINLLLDIIKALVIAVGDDGLAF